MNGNNPAYFDSFGDGHISKEIKNCIENKKIVTSIYKIQIDGLKMYWHFWVGFIDFMLKGKSLLDYTNLFSHSKYEKIDNITLKYIQ